MVARHPLPPQRSRAASVELLPCPRPERVVEVRHSDFPPLAMVVHTSTTNEPTVRLRPGDNKRTTLWILLVLVGAEVAPQTVALRPSWRARFP